MFIAVYRWTVKPGDEDRFVRAWHDGTIAITRRYGSFGSRMHREDGGDFIGYAQWPSRAAWQAAWAAHFDHDDKNAAHEFNDSIAESHGPVLLMEVLDDLLIPAKTAP